MIPSGRPSTTVRTGGQHTAKGSTTIADLAPAVLPVARDEAAEDAWALGHIDGLMRAYARNGEVNSVAVVGNAPLEPDPARAAAIDACDLVVRVNGFALDKPGDPVRVGSKVDVVVFNRGLRATPWVFQDYRSRLYLLVEPGRLHWEPELIPDWWPADLGFVAIPNREVTVPLADALGLPVRTEPTWATTGTMAVWLAATRFSAAALHLAGFSFVDDPTQTSWLHAWGEGCVVGPEHQIATESRLLNSWLESGRAQLWR